MGWSYSECRASGIRPRPMAVAFWGCGRWYSLCTQLETWAQGVSQASITFIFDFPESNFSNVKQRFIVANDIYWMSQLFTPSLQISYCSYQYTSIPITLSVTFWKKSFGSSDNLEMHIFQWPKSRLQQIWLHMNIFSCMLHFYFGTHCMW